MKTWIAAGLAILASVLAGTTLLPQRERGQAVQVIRVPNGGIQPQVALDSKGTLHMIYFKGDPGHGDIFYVRSKDWGNNFSSPIRVNSEPETAVASGTIRGAHIAVGKNGRIHVAWNGSVKSSMRGPRMPDMPKESPYNGLPMLYARLNDSGTSFEKDRNLMKLTFGLDGGGAVAADSTGKVYVAWHGKRLGDPDGEGGRSIWIARSLNGGRDFSPEHKAYQEPTGACGCCAVSIFAGKNGTVYIMYRTAKETVNRDICLLVSKDDGMTFKGRLIDKWNIAECPMSSSAFAEGAGMVLTAWQTKEQVYYASIDPATLQMSEPIQAPGMGKLRKYPALATNSNGDVLLVWTEDAGWGKGGSLAWQAFNKKGQLSAEKGRVSKLPAWSFGAAFTRPDGEFVIMY